jgi:hypothetical protein
MGRRFVQNPIGEAGNAGGVDHLEGLELDRDGTEVVEQPDAALQQDRDDVEVVSSTLPACNACCTGAEPMRRTAQDPAAAAACSMARSIPSAT